MFRKESERIFRAALGGFILVVSALFLSSYLSGKSKIDELQETLNIANFFMVKSGIKDGVENSISGIHSSFGMLLAIFFITIIGFSAFTIFLFNKYLDQKRNAFIDPLTELYNRRAIMFILNKELLKSERYNHPTSIAVLDIDFFKKYNDIHGHVAGDKLLKKFAKILVREVREVDTVGRMGGEEFIIIFPETPLKDAVKVCERVRKTLENTEFPGMKELPFGKLTASIGVAETRGGKHVKAEEIINIADQCLYVAKTSGRNKIAYKKS